MVLIQCWHFYFRKFENMYFFYLLVLINPNVAGSNLHESRNQLMWECVCEWVNEEFVMCFMGIMTVLEKWCPSVIILLFACKEEVNQCFNLFFNLGPECTEVNTWTHTWTRIRWICSQLLLLPLPALWTQLPPGRTCCLSDTESLTPFFADKRKGKKHQGHFHLKKSYVQVQLLAFSVGKLSLVGEKCVLWIFFKERTRKSAE